VGKASDNERIKLAATFLNNFAVGLGLAGGLIPFILFVQTLDRDEIISFHLSDKNFRIAVTSIGAVLVSLVFRFAADQVLKKIKD